MRKVHFGAIEVVAGRQASLLLFPLYSLADLSVRRLLPRRATGTSDRPAGRDGAGVRHVSAGTAPQGPPVINYVRVPAPFSLLLLLLVWFPLILGLSSAEYHWASDLSTAPYLWRWLAVTGAMFTISAVSYALRLRRSSSQARRARALAAPGR